MTRYVRRAVRLLRTLSDLGPGPTAAVVALLVVAALMPSGLAVALGLLVNAVESSAGTQGSGPAGVSAAAMLPLVGFAAVYLLGYFAESLVGPLEYLAVSRVDRAHRARVAQMVAEAPTLDLVEDADTQRMIREVEADPRMGFDRTPGQGALGQVRALAGLVGVLCAAAVLAVHAWWLPLVVLAPATLNRFLRNQQAVVITRHWQAAMSGEMHADVWRRATVDAGAGKETRVLGLAQWMTDRMQRHIREANTPLWRYVNRLVLDEWSQLLLVVVGLAPALLLVTLAAADGSGSLAVQATVLSAGTAVFQLLGSSGAAHRIAGGDAVLTTTAKLAERLRPTDGGGHGPRVPGRGLTASALSGAMPVVTFERVSFRYPGTERLVLDSLDLTVGGGENLALVGLNGSGKSTLVKLLCGLYRPTAGRILVDGTDLADLDPGAWRSRLAVIFQDFVHYPLSLADNVTLGHGTPDEALGRAVSQTGIARVVDRLPDGWRTPLSRSRDGGVDLSGGQWQQVALTRAWLAVERGARLLVLDEPTAHLDVRTEAETYERLAGLRGTTGSLLITHRLATVRSADRIVLLEHGAIVESGDHDALMRLDGRYAEMFRAQAQRFENDLSGSRGGTE
ncbi:ABC transporter ATP-binding protein [Xylanimonas oleitrophica]|uniref:ABC transporter ATP-binding protein n=1 Tax=Xylanimonas oleitrophica TaxID=2607479 RepID=A0A2W5WMZ4_9MICO|nr:ABC transporter ATP-binding protein [Xylanimonas oleitrophica]PZR52372.1 ABC transporter ATP-binding protein [Xylanimonas oleitrophica]